MRLSFKSVVLTLGALLSIALAFMVVRAPEALGGVIKPLVLGLDIRGGSQLLLELDIPSLEREAFESMQHNIRQTLRAKGYRVRHMSIVDNSQPMPSHQSSDAEQPLYIRGQINASLDDIRKALGSEYHVSFDAFQNTTHVKDNDWGIFVRVGLAPHVKQRMQQSALERTLDVVRYRIDHEGVKEGSIQSQGDRRILVQMPGVDDPAALKNLLGTTGKLTFHRVLPQGDKNGVTKLNEQGATIVIDPMVLLSGAYLIESNVVMNPEAQVAFVFNKAGADIFAEITGPEYAGTALAMVLDDKVISAPLINDTIRDGRGVISGKFTVEDASRLALLMRSGALPAPLKILEEKTLGPSFGFAAMHSAVRASYAAFFGLVVLMVLAYSAFGLFAVLSLVINVACLIVGLALCGATLTLPGIAGIALTMGMAVDANVLINERIREELALGRHMRLALAAGYRRSLGAIMDANITTILGGIVLGLYGTGPIRGFAVTLIIGVLSSMFASVLMSRIFVEWWLFLKNPQKIWI